MIAVLLAYLREGYEIFKVDTSISEPPFVVGWFLRRRTVADDEQYRFIALPDGWVKPQ